MPPGVWQPTHLSAKIGATSAHVGAALAAAGRLLPEPAAIVTATPAAAATATSAKPILLRCTPQS
jgi:hypothetical protein